MHLQDTSHTLFLIFCGIQNVRTGVHGSGIHTEICQFSNEGVGHDLEHQCGEGLFIRRVSHDGVAVQIGSLDGRNIGGRRHVLQDRVQKLLHALVSVGGTAADRNSGALAGGLPQNSLHLFHRRNVVLQIAHHQIVIQLADFLNEFGVVQFGIVLHILGDIGDGNVLALVIVVNVGLHLEQIDDSLELILFSDGQLQDNGVLAQTGADLIYRVVEVSSQDIHLVDECHTGYVVGICLTPYVFRLGLYTALGAEHAYGSVQHTQGTLYLNGEVHMSGGIDDVDAVLQSARFRLAVFLQGPVAGGSGGGNGDTTLLLLLHPVHGRRAFVSISNLVVHTGVVQDTLGQSGLSGVNVSHNTDVSGSL